MPAGVLVDGELQQGYGGGTCQVSSTLYNVVLQLPGLTVLQRRAHGDNGASYLPIGVDAAVGNSQLNFRFRNDYPFPLRIDASSQDGALTIAIYRAE
jgi:vancomycin resistance protein YoaR